MIPASVLIRRLGLAQRALAHLDRAAGPVSAGTRRRATEAAAQLEKLTPAAIGTAARRLDEQAAGYPAQSGGASSTGSSGDGQDHSDRVGELAASALDGEGDHVAAISAELADASLHLERAAWRLLTAGTAQETRSAGFDADAHTKTVLRIITAWARAPEIRWCTHCWNTNRHRAPVWSGRYRDLCRRCGDWRAVNKQLPPRDILGYLQRGDSRIPQPLLDRHRAKRPRS